ncbi:Baculoviral IAP repeat-containing protein 6, partial [Orchesella cincta]
SGLNIQKNHVVSAGPTVCQHFYNFLLRLRQLSNDTVWTPCLKEVLLRVLGVFLSTSFLNADFPLDAFNKFLDRVTCPDLSYENPTTIVCIIQSFASALHRFVFFPSKLNIRSAAELKAGTTGVGSAIAGTSLDTKTGRGQTVDMIMFRLVTFMASVVSLPYKKFTDVKWYGGSRISEKYDDCIKF